MSNRMSADGYHIPLPPTYEPLVEPTQRPHGSDPQAYAAAFRDGMRRAGEIARTAHVIHPDDGDAFSAVDEAKRTIAEAIEREANT
jgi:hypothetical protein